MHLNSRAENIALSLNFMGKKLRNHTVAPATKQHHKVASVSTRAREREDDVPVDMKIFIPYDSAKLCITQIADDMVAMKGRHLEMVQELEENFLIASKENQERTVHTIRTYYQNKMNALKRVLDIYQEKVERRSALWEEKIKSLQSVNENLQEEQKALQERNRHDLATWQREKGDRDSGAPIDGAKARLEMLRESLYKREREISMLIEGGEGLQDSVAPSAYTRLLAAVVRQAHLVYAEVTEAKERFDQMAEDNCKAAEDRDGVTSLQEDQTDMGSVELRPPGKDQSEIIQADEVTQAEVKLQKHEILHLALECIKAGVTPTIAGAVSEEDSAALDESVKKFKEERFKNSDVLNSEVGKSVGQQLLLLQAENKTVQFVTSRYLHALFTGKIRVFCRIRPQTRAELARGSTTIVSCLDDYSVNLETPRGPREFQFDRIFTTAHTQDDVFQESSRLIQSAIDGFNVCIFAYGQTGSGKTFTMLGDREQKNPGIVPRTFTRIFEIIQENETKFEFKVSASMLELYNDRLQDLFVSPAEALSKRIEIKKDKKGLIFAQGAEAKEATSAGELFALFALASANRHIAATKMNIESSRSHLIISIMLESRNLANGSMTFGKLNLVDLAGSERAAKTGAKDDQLKEANSINKSLSALGDVISALAMDQAHVPYRNNKLTQLMQDSLGGNAKTLMFLNISPSSCNLDETLTSLIYASRVKAITNHAQRNMESKEIAQLKE
ncbi:kinesin-like calmodulin-binding protein, partial [Clarias magur]